MLKGALEQAETELEQCKKKVETLISTHSALVKTQRNVQGREIVRQRRHRKWALKKAESWRDEARIFEAESNLFRYVAEKAEAEVKRLKAILANAGKDF